MKSPGVQSRKCDFGRSQVGHMNSPEPENRPAQIKSLELGNHLAKRFDERCSLLGEEFVVGITNKFSFPTRAGARLAEGVKKVDILDTPFDQTMNQPFQLLVISRHPNQVIVAGKLT